MSEKHKKEPSGVGIVGLGSYAPEKILSNSDLEKIVDTSDEWIRERTGIERRHILEDDRATSDTASEAARRAMEDAGVAPDDIDVMIVGTATPDMFFPSTACLVQKNRPYLLDRRAEPPPEAFAWWEASRNLKQLGKHVDNAVRDGDLTRGAALAVAGVVISLAKPERRWRLARRAAEIGESS